MLEAEAAERKRAGGGDHKSEVYKKSVGEDLRQPINTERAPKSTQIAAANLGISDRTVEKAKRIAKAAPEYIVKIMGPSTYQRHCG